jgi:uncharacterized protein YrrD
MLQLSKSFINRPVMSLRTGAQVALATMPIINPNNLKIEGFYCQDRFSKSKLILLEKDIRDIISQGIVINDHDVLSEQGELIRLRDVLEIDFQLMGKPVFTVNKHRLGKVNDYAVDTSTMYVHKLYIGPPLIKAFSGGQLSVDRTQIVEITHRKIVVQEPLQPTKVTAAAPVAATAAS